jgi:hypothetical protein
MTVCTILIVTYQRFTILTDLFLAEPKWSKLDTHGDIPTARYCTTLNSVDDKLVLFGGFDGDRLNTVHFLNLSMACTLFKLLSVLTVHYYRDPRVEVRCD